MEENRRGQTAILVLFLSDYKNNKQEEKYFYDGGGAETGIQTNDAPTKYLLREAHDAGNEIGDVFCITSRKVFEERIGDAERTAIDAYRDMMGDVLLRRNSQNSWLLNH